MARAIEGSTYESVGDELLKGSNLWFFIEEDIGGTIKSWNAFVKECGLKDSHEVIGGNIEGVNYDAKGVEAISKLPSKLELIAQIAGAIKAVPTKVARVTNAPGTKMARAIKLAGEKVNE
jgi:large subunit ribosomal protein L10